MIWAILFPVVFVIATASIDSGNLSTGINYSLNQNCTPTCDPQGQLEATISNVLFFLIPALLTRRMRLLAVGALSTLTSISDRSVEEVESVFKGASRRLPQVGLAVLVLLVFVLGGSTSGPPSPGVLTDVGGLFSYAYSLLGFGCFIWVYFIVLRGLRTYGTKYLVLVSPQLDSTQGARPLGSLSLSITATYFGLVAVGLVTAVFTSFDVAGAILIGGLLSFGILMFFLPLYSIHLRMITNKQEGKKKVREELAEILDGRGKEPGEEGDSIVLTRIEKILGLQMVERNVSSAHTWPFDTTILSRLAAVALSMIAILLSTLVRNVLKF